jgi:hypothetical protein
MLKTTLQIVNGSTSKVNCISVGATIRVPALSTITKVVNESAADAIISALATKYPSLVVTDQGDYDDGVAYPYMPFAKNKLIATTAPGVTNDTSEGYSIGSIWIDTTASPRAVYQCVDSATDAAVWKNLTLDDQPFAEKTPVNAVAASGTVTFSATGPAVHVANVQASGTLTFSGFPSTPYDDDTVTIGTDTAEKVYTFKTTLTPTEGQVLIGADTAEALANLKLAINRTDPTTNDGVKYKIAAANPTVTADAIDATTLGITAIVAGAAGNSIASVGSNHGAFGAATLENGVDHIHESLTVGTDEFIFVTSRTGAGSKEITVSTNTTTMAENTVAAINADSTVATAANTGAAVTVTAAVKGAAGNLIALTKVATATTITNVTSNKLKLGIDGTVGVANETCADASYLYHCVAANTVSGTNWRRVALGTAY